MEWNIQSRSHSCQGCQKAFSDKEAFHTLLFHAGAGYERLDVCDPCWKEQVRAGATERKGFISYWQGVYQVPPPNTEPIQKATAETLLRKLVERDEPAYAAARFILAAMLERKRILKVKAQVIEEKQRVFIYEHIKSGELWHIADPKLALDQLEDIQRQVAGLLERGLETGGSAPEAPVPDPPEAAAKLPQDGPLPAPSEASNE